MKPLDGGLKRTFPLVVIALAGRHGRFPSSFTITDDIEVSDKIFASDGFADVKSEVYEERPVRLAGFTRERHEKDSERKWFSFP